MLHTVGDFEAKARERIPSASYDYFAGGAGVEETLRENELSWKAIRLLPRVLVDVSEVDLATTVLGTPCSMPLITGPCALNTLAHPEGECGVARACAREGVVQTVSTLSSFSLEEIAGASGGSKWFQLYVHKDRSLTKDLVQRAEASGYSVICLTVDVPIPGIRLRDLKNRFSLPENIRPGNFERSIPGVSDGSSYLSFVADQLDPSLTWRDIEWLRGVTRLPLLLKGILSPEDASLAVASGVAGICVSNHGGRQLDSSIATCQALPRIVDVVGASVEIYVDGGIRSGLDVFKAIALGARAVLIGRPYLWGLSVGGEAGVSRILDCYRSEFRSAMTLAGARSVPAIHSGFIAKSP